NTDREETIKQKICSRWYWTIFGWISTAGLVSAIATLEPSWRGVVAAILATPFSAFVAHAAARIMIDSERRRTLLGLAQPKAQARGGGGDDRGLHTEDRVGRLGRSRDAGVDLEPSEYGQTHAHPAGRQSGPSGTL